MIFGTEIKTFPVCIDEALGQETAELYSCNKNAVQLIKAVAGTSSYLRGILKAEKDWLAGALDKDAIDVLDAIFGSAKDASDETLPQELRRAKKRVALTLALLDLSGIWPVEQITTKLTEFADLSVELASQAACRKFFTQKDLSRAPAAGLCALAMGKMGAFELNYSSDIDVIFLFDDSIWLSEDVPEKRALFVKAVREVVKTLSHLDANGYVFRTDLRLRPNPSVTPVCVAMSSAENYYAKDARTWERSAFVKARVCAGDMAAGNAFLDRVSGFIWRKHMNFSAARDIQSVQDQIREQRASTETIKARGHNLKLGLGGIREIEFYVQARQLIFGGRDEALRLRGTLPALSVLVDKEIVDADTALVLKNGYRRLRNLEHRIQMLQDAQTHDVPSSDDQLARLVALDASDDSERFRAELKSLLHKIHDVTQAVFKVETQAAPASEFTENQQKYFELWSEYRVLKHPTAIDVFENLKPFIISHLDASNDPDAMLQGFDMFLSNLTAGVELFSLFEARKDLFLLVLDLCALSSNFARRLASNVMVLDGLAFDSVFTVFPDAITYQEMLEHRISRAQDFEEQLSEMRRWQNEQHFQIVVQQLRGAVVMEAAALAFTQLAQASLEVAAACVQADFVRRHGKIDGSELAVLAMGKMASFEMTSQSDLDLIVVFVGQDDAMSDGSRSLDIRTYYARLTKALINALSAPMSGGTLYEVDMRLRPSGRKGPVATGLLGFEKYQREEAWVWEHLALTRARSVAGHNGIQDRLSEICRNIILTDHAPENVAMSVDEMRQRLYSKPISDPQSWPIKRSKGGLLDIELFAQALTLVGGLHANAPRLQIKEAAASDLLEPHEAEALVEAHRFFSHIEHLKRMMFDQSFTSDKIPATATEIFLRDTKTSSISELESRMEAYFDRSKDIIRRNLTRMRNGTG